MAICFFELKKDVPKREAQQKMQQQPSDESMPEKCCQRANRCNVRCSF